VHHSLESMRGEAVAAVVVLIVASLGLGYLSGSGARSTETVSSVSTSTVTSTTTYTSTETTTSVITTVATQTSTLTTASVPTSSQTETVPAGAELLTTSSGSWTFQAELNATTVNLGGALLVKANLTYEGATSVNFSVDNPFVLFSVYNSTGGPVQVLEVPGINTYEPIAPGQTLQGRFCLSFTPTSVSDYCLYFNNPKQPPEPGPYTFDLAPGIFSAQEGQSLENALQVSTIVTLAEPQ
jgi:hypothetical protein